MQGFADFIRKQGVVGLAVGFILGGAVKEVVSSLVTDIVSPLLGLVLGATGNLDKATLSIGKVTLLWGHFLSSVVDFVVIAAIIYYGVKGLGLEKLDKKG